MNKKDVVIAVIFIAAILIIGGISFRRFSKKNVSPEQTAHKSDASVAVDSSKVMASSEGGENLVEVFYLPHPPVDPIRKKIKNILEKFPEYKLREYDFYDENNKQKITAYQLLGHIPVAVFINGKDVFLIDGQEITFKNFPKGDAFVPTLEGSWSYDDLEKVLADPQKYQE
jgi:hypothetical protein